MKSIRTLVCVAVLMLLCANACAGEIGEEAFMGDTSLTRFAVFDGCLSIGDRAFAGCSELNEITIPPSVTAIADDAFAGCSPALMVICDPLSAAADALSGYDLNCNETRRALIIGQDYTGNSAGITQLIGPTNDAPAMTNMLASQPLRPFSVTSRANLVGADLTSAIAAAFAGATENDISLLYYSGHGGDDGSLIGYDGVWVSPAAVKAALDKVPGRKVVIIDACYSGQYAQYTFRSATTQASSDEADMSAFVEGFMAPFQVVTRSAVLRAAASGSYYVMAACQYNELSGEKNFSVGSVKRKMGIFTHSFLLGCGWEGVTNQRVAMQADANGDGTVSIGEAFLFARDTANSIYSLQTAACNNPTCANFAPFR